ncbi:MAG: hypothetical protein GY953_29880 [bacterium]|nr:hypothetical protein [bacterium]
MSSSFDFQIRVYDDPERQRKWDRIQIRKLVRSRLKMKWRDYLSIYFPESGLES